MRPRTGQERHPSVNVSNTVQIVLYDVFQKFSECLLFC